MSDDTRKEPVALPGTANGYARHPISAVDWAIFTFTHSPGFRVEATPRPKLRLIKGGKS